MQRKPAMPPTKPYMATLLRNTVPPNPTNSFGLIRDCWPVGGRSSMGANHDRANAKGENHCRPTFQGIASLGCVVAIGEAPHLNKALGRRNPAKALEFLWPN